MSTLCLDLHDAHDQPLTFVTRDAEWAGERWNGFPAPRLPKWQAYLLALLMGEDDTPPRAEMDEDASQEAAYVHMDGLTWYACDDAGACLDCGMPHSAQHACEPISWADSAS